MQLTLSMSAAFRALPDVEVGDESTPLPLGPAESLKHGQFKNGLTYYVRPCTKPQKRAAIALAVKVGSVVETEEERGVAHILEHLAFNATKSFENHAIIAFLESIGSEFGACQNAYTSADETVYEVLVPTDDEKFLRQALHMLAEFACHIRCAPEDLAKERGAVLEEWRMGRDSRGRAQEAQWKLMLQGTQYADRLPIGLESVIRNVPAETVKAFYDRWYRPENMALVAIGDFDDVDGVVETVREFMEPCQPHNTEHAVDIPRFSLVEHEEPRYSVFTDAEAQSTLVWVTYKHDRSKVATPAEFVEYLAAELFQSCVNERLFKLSRLESPPFYVAQIGSEPLTSTIECFTLSAQPQEGPKHTLVALETLLTEMARIRAHGFSEREVAIARSKLMSDIEGTYLEREQSYATDVRDEYVRHFLHGEFVVGQEYEARLSKALLPRVTMAHLADLVNLCRTDRSCVIKTVAHRSHETEAQLAEVVACVAAAEAAGSIQPWPYEDAPVELVGELPPPGQITSRIELPELEATELVLSNGMRVTYKRTEFLHDQVLMSGFAAGGLTEVPESDYRCVSFANVVAGELGMFGLRPEVMSDVLAGKRVDVSVGESAYWRTFGGDQSPEDLETALQLVYRLFTETVEPVETRLDTCRRITREQIVAQIRNPLYSWGQRVKFLNYGECYYFRPPTLKDVDALDPVKACEHFNQAYRDPAEFRVCLTGAIEEEVLLPLVCQYLGAIPRAPEGGSPAARSPQDVTPLPFGFPQQPVREDVKVPMIMEMTRTQITFPVEIDRPHSREEAIWVAIVTKLVETKLMQLLRFKFGEVYTVSVSAFFGAEAPSHKGNVRGDMAINFSCAPESAGRLVDLALDEVEALQAAGPSAEEVDTVRTVLNRALETQQQENSFWHEQLVGGYQSRSFQELGDLDAVYRRFTEARSAVLAQADPVSTQAALCRLLPHPARKRYTAITLLPQPSVWQRTVLAVTTRPSPRTAGLVATAAVLASVATFAVVRAWRKGARPS